MATGALRAKRRGGTRGHLQAAGLQRTGGARSASTPVGQRTLAGHSCAMACGASRRVQAAICSMYTDGDLLCADTRGYVPVGNL